MSHPENKLSKPEIPYIATTREERTKDYRGNHDADWCGWLFFESEAGLQNGFDLLHRIFSKRTNYFFCNFEYIKEHYDSNYPESIAEVQNKVIENVKTFRRLNQIRWTLNRHCWNKPSLAELSFYELKNKLTNYKILLKTRVLIFNSMVGSRLTYSCI